MPVTPSELRRGPRKVVIRFADPLLRDTVANWVDSLPGYQVAGAVEGAAALIELCTVRPPDVAVVQLRSAERTELSLIAELRCVRPGPHVVGLHQALDPASLLRLHRAGANRLVSSRLGLPALRAALGEPDDEPARRPGRGELSGRELEILALLGAGCSVADIASALEISTHTVANHKRHIFNKLHVHNRAQAVAQIGRLGLFCGTLGDRRSDRVVVVGPQPDPRSAVADALRRGAGAVLADADADELLPAVNALVRAGYLVAAEEVMRELLAGRLDFRTARPHLTRRERDILKAVARGQSVSQTAAAFGVTVKTVQSQHRQLFAKLGARNRVAALARARQLGLVER